MLLGFRKALLLFKGKQYPIKRNLGVLMQNLLLQSSVLLIEPLLLVGYTLFILFNIIFVTCSKPEAFHT